MNRRAPRRSGDARFRVLATFLPLGCCLAACSPEGPRPEATTDLEAALGAPSTWRLQGDGRPARRARDAVFLLEVHPFEGVLESLRPLEIETDTSLRLLPIVDSAPTPGCEFVVLSSDESGETELFRGEPRFLRGARPGALIGRLVDSIEIHLRGIPTRLRFEMRGPCRDLRAAVAASHLARPPPQSLPAVLLICSDQHRFDHSLEGRGVELMPRLHSLAEESIVYRHAYANASWTLPSIVSALTGVLPRFHGTGRRVETGLRRDWPQGRRVGAGRFFISWGPTYYVLQAYSRELVSLPERLRRRGYRNLAVVSNSLYALSGLVPDGFDLAVATGTRGDRDVNDAALSALRAVSPESPLFLLVHYMDVHEYQTWAPKKARDAGMPIEALREEYAKRVREADAHLAVLLDAWDRQMGKGRSLIVFYSDHGEHLGEPGARGRHGVSMDEVLLRVPLLVRYPDELGIAAGVEDAPVSLVDLVPTVLAVTGSVPDGANLHGTSLLELPEGRERDLFADYQLHGDEMSSLRSGRYKLVVNWSQQTRTLLVPESASPKVPESAWRVEDPSAQEELGGRFDAYVRDADEFTSLLSRDQEIDQDEAVEQLRALGYVE